MCAASRLCRRGLTLVGLVELLEECVHLGRLCLHLKLKVSCHFQHLVLAVLVAGGELLLEVLDVVIRFLLVPVIVCLRLVKSCWSCWMLVWMVCVNSW